MLSKVLIALPAAMLREVDFAAQCEYRNRSELIREALRTYLSEFKSNHIGMVINPNQKESTPYNQASHALITKL